jgi:hypothetical protein
MPAPRGFGRGMRVPISPVMRSSVALLAAGLCALGVAVTAAAASPGTAIRGPAVHAHATATADAQLIAALKVRMVAARQLEHATLAAIEQRLRAIYATPDEDPVMVLLAGNISEAVDLANLNDAVSRSDQQLLLNYTTSLANLQTAQAELAQNMLRVTAGARLAAARAAARATAHTATRTAPLPALVGGTGAGGLPAAIVNQHALPGAVPIDPRTGRPYHATP